MINRTNNCLLWRTKYDYCMCTRQAGALVMSWHSSALIRSYFGYSLFTINNHIIEIYTRIISNSLYLSNQGYIPQYIIWRIWSIVYFAMTHFLVLQRRYLNTNNCYITVQKLLSCIFVGFFCHKSMTLQMFPSHCWILWYYGSS